MHTRTFFLVFTLLLTSLSIPAQSLRFGIQSGITLSNALYEGGPTGFNPSSLLRYRIGFNLRKPLKKTFTFRWGKFSNKSKIFLDAGVHLNFSGRYFELDMEDWTTEVPAFEVPIIFTFKVKNGWWSKWRGENYKPTWGAQLGLKWSSSWQKAESGPLLNDEGIVRGNLDLEKSRRNNLILVAGPGIFRETPKGEQIYLGINANLGLVTQAKGTIDWVNAGPTATTFMTSLGNYYSLDLQYFFGKQKARMPEKIYPVIFCPQL